MQNLLLCLSQRMRFITPYITYEIKDTDFAYIDSFKLIIDIHDAKSFSYITVFKTYN